MTGPGPADAGPRVAVIGAGIAGLTAAYRLQQAGCTVTVLEQGTPETVGGRMASVARGGFHIDLGGPLLARRYRRMLNLIGEIGAAGQVLTGGDKAAVLHHGTLRRGRTGTLLRLARGGLLDVVSPRDRLRLLRDLHRHRPHLDTVDMTGATAFTESAREYRQRRGLARDVESHLLDPLGAIMTLTGPEEVSALTPFLMLTLLAAGRGFFTSAHGSGFLPQRLAELVPITFRTEVAEVSETSTEVRVTSRNADGTSVTTSADAAVLAVPPPQLARITPQLEPELRQAFLATRYPPMIQVTYCLNRPTTETAALLVTSRRDLPQLACFVLQHNLAPGRVPHGTAMVTAYLRAEPSVQLWDACDITVERTLTVAVRRAGLFPELDNRLIACHIDRTPQAVVARPAGCYRTLAALPPPRLGRTVLAGADLYAHSTTIGSLASGEAAAAQVIQALFPGPRKE